MGTRTRTGPGGGRGGGIRSGGVWAHKQASVRVCRRLHVCDSRCVALRRNGLRLCALYVSCTEMLWCKQTHLHSIHESLSASCMHAASMH